MKTNGFMCELSVIIPCFNEEANIRDIVSVVLELFNESLINGEVILINDGSSDGTWPTIQAMKSQYKNIVGINHEYNFGITEAWYDGICHARGKYVVTIDADSQYDPRDIQKLYSQIIENNCDLVQGWRKAYKDNNILRNIISIFLSGMLNILFFSRKHDIKSGFVIAKKEVFADILKERNKFRLFQHFFILCALRKGYCLKQVPVTFYARTKGRSFITNPAFFSLRVLLDLPKAIVEFGAISRLLKRGKN